MILFSVRLFPSIGSIALATASRLAILTYIDREIQQCITNEDMLGNYSTLAVVAIESELDCASTAKSAVEGDLKYFYEYYRYFYVEDAAALFACFKIDLTEDEPTLRRCAAQVLVVAYMQGYEGDFGIRTKALEDEDYD